MQHALTIIVPVALVLLLGVVARLTAASPAPLTVIVRWLDLTGLALLLGLFSFRLLVWLPTYRDEALTAAERALDRRQTATGLAAGGLGVLLIGASVILLPLAPGGDDELLAAVPWLRAPEGAILGVRLVLLALLAAVLWRQRRTLANGAAEPAGDGWWLGLALTLGLLLTTTLSRQSAALATAVDFGHGLAAGIWAGGLLMLGLALWQARALEEPDRVWLALSLNVNFTTLAAGAIGLLLLSGGYLAGQHIGSWTTLLATPYGRVLLLKVGLALPALAIAAVNLLYTRPRLDAVYETPATAGTQALLRRYSWLVRLEALLALAVLAGAGLMTNLQRGVEAPLLADPPARRTLTQMADDLTVTLILEPALIGANTIDIQVTGEDGRPLANVHEVVLRFTTPSRAVGTVEAIARDVGDSHYRLVGSYLSQADNWQIEVVVRRPEHADTFVPYRLESGLGGSLQPAGAGGNRLGQLARFLDQRNGLISGLALVLAAVVWGFMATRVAQHEWQLVPLLFVGIVAFAVGGFQLYNFYQEYTPAAFATNPYLPDAGSIARGRALYEQRCIVCHGPEGRGDGLAAAALAPPPADFTAGHTEIHPDGDLYYWIKRGVVDTAMPAFEAELTDDEVWHLVNYVRRLSASSSGAADLPPASDSHDDHH